MPLPGFLLDGVEISQILRAGAQATLLPEAADHRKERKLAPICTRLHKGIFSQLPDVFEHV